MQCHLGIKRWDQAEGDLQKTRPLRWQVDGTPFRLANLDALLLKEIMYLIHGWGWGLLLCRRLKSKGGCEHAS